MDFQDADLKDVLKIFSQQADLNFIAGENVKDRKVTLYLDKVSVEDALNTIMRANNLSYEQKRGSEIFVVKESGKPEVETITKIFPLQYGRVKGCELSAEGEKRKEIEQTGIKEVIEELLTEHGRIIENSQTNSLIITDVPSQFPRIEKTIKELDIKVLQVMIEVEIVETSVDTLDKLGIEWGSSTEGILASAYGASRTTTYPFTKPQEMRKVGPAGDPSSLYTGFISAEYLGGALAMLSKDTDTRTLARPKILTLNGKEARIIIGERYPYIVKTITETSTTEETKFEDIGTALRVTPWVTPDGWITMYLHPEISSLKRELSAGPYINTKEVEVTVRVRDGETVIIGGLISTKDTKALRKVPFLGDIPLLGNIFRKKEDEVNDTELIIFITPHLVKEGAATLGLALERQAPWEYENLGLKEEAMEMFLDRFEE
jgi:type IV pilus assembly protein PilQ